MKNQQKGYQLEKAVELIQRTILEQNPDLQGTKFSIECNKIFNQNGVRHEIDVLVRTLEGTQYESLWIFECKNWKTPVGKNEIIVFSEKIKVLGAARGFIVAKRFSKDAEAQAATDARLKLVECTDDFTGPITAMRMVHLATDQLPITMELKERNVPPSPKPKPFDWKNALCKLEGKPIVLAEFIHMHVEKMVSEEKSENWTRYEEDGVHFGKRNLMITFYAGEFLVNAMDVEYMIIAAQFFTTVTSRKLIAKFEVKGQGRTYHFEPIVDSDSGRRIAIAAVQCI